MSFDYNRTITIRARPATVWRFFSEPEMFARWWGAGSSIEARVGAPMRIVYPDASSASGEVLALEPERMIAFSFGYDTPGKPIAPGGSRVTITLEAVAEGTRIELRHELDDANVRDMHAAGWRYHLAVFAKVVQAEQHRDLELRVDRYFRAWAELSFESRAAVLAGAVSDDVRFADAHGFTRGRVELERHIAAALTHMRGVELVRRGAVRSCQGVALADWELRAGERVLGSGTNVFELDADGMIAAVTGITS
ncbi:MAG TPA: SRPBCC domain-containing protein [Enhygromyxa sp.]|nr:SRPBCC domain-containing protein [Enhygromyxa sp.]